jgi:hypothetical protein
MKFPRTIGFRITLGFGILILAMLASAFLSYRIIEGIQATREELTGVLEPSIRRLIEFRNTLHRARDIVKLRDRESPEEESLRFQELRFYLETKLPDSYQQVIQLSDGWRQRDRDNFDELYGYISDSLSPAAMTCMRQSLLSVRADTLTGAGPANQTKRIFNVAEEELDAMIQRFDRLAIQANEQFTAIYRQSLNFLLVSGIIIALAAILIAILLYLALVNPIRQYSAAITSMGKGVIPEKKFREGSDEMGQIGAALNNMIRGLKDLSVFAEEIGKGNFKSDFTPLSENDILGNSLIRLREDLQNAAIEEEKRKREDERRNWSNQGIARFSDILREYSGDTKALGEKLISELVKYLEAKVGGIFLVRQGDGDPVTIDLVASYAYDRTKHLKKSIRPGEGLVGRCIQEGSTIFLTDIPRGYIKIKSGLGEDDPRSLLLVPIRLHELIVGVIELASLEIFQDFQIEFVERIGSSIASSWSASST